MREELIRWKYGEVGERLIETFEKLGIKGIYVQRKEDVAGIIRQTIPERSVVAVGGSVTLDQCGVLDLLRNENYNFIDRYAVKDRAEKEEAFRAAFRADYFICSANAITANGEIVQLDAYGTRVAPMLFGPGRVLLVVGMNKVVADIDGAFDRIRNIAPMNAKRLNMKTPCSITGQCSDCRSEERICESYVVIRDSNARKGRYTVLLVGEDLGL